MSISNLKKAEELVEWMATKFLELQDELKEKLVDIGCSGRYEFEYKKGMIEVTKQILSHPDLALIVKRMEVPVCCQECQCQNLFHAIKEVISLAEALKKEGNGKNIH